MTGPQFFAFVVVLIAGLAFAWGVFKLTERMDAQSDRQ